MTADTLATWCRVERAVAAGQTLGAIQAEVADTRQTLDRFHKQLTDAADELARTPGASGAARAATILRERVGALLRVMYPEAGRE